MAFIITDNQHYIDIAAAIRAKSGSDSAYTPAQMADAITGIPIPDNYGLVTYTQDRIITVS